MSDLSAINFPWLQATEQKLVKLKQTNRLPHALLIEGQAGIGKRSLAQWFGQLMMCTEPKETANGIETPCGSCKSCLLFEQMTHPDFLWLEPEEAGKQIKVQQVRALSDFIGTHSQQGGYRVIVIAPAEAMNIAASNALLKGLEEPGDDTMFLLVSDRPGQLLPTIKSRCQRIPLSPPQKPASCQWLDSQVESNTDAVELVLQLSGGSPLSAKELLENDNLSLRDKLIDSLKSTAGNKLSVPNAAQQWVKGDLIQTLGWLASLVNDMVRFSQLQTADSCHNKDAEKLIIRASQRIETAALFAFSDKIQEYRQLLLAKHNPNPQLLCEDLLIRWLSIVRKQ